MKLVTLRTRLRPSTSPIVLELAILHQHKRSLSEYLPLPLTDSGFYSSSATVSRGSVLKFLELL
ncbi:hypothetical protein Mapa_001627 [Marchantia paleacea]|nr:hypothetical protein Mapa_001627 [Marchantia paleacea]